MWKIVFLLIASAVAAKSASIDDLIAAGRLGEAYGVLESTYGDAAESSEYFLLSGLSTDIGENSVSDLKDFINRGSGSPYMIDWARMHLGKYYISQGLFGTAQKMFEEIPATSAFAAEAAYLAGRCCILSGDNESAEKIFQDAVKQFNPTRNKSQAAFQTEYYYWSVYGLGESKSVRGDNAAAEKLYKQLLEPQLESNITPLALLGLAKAARQAKKMDQANQYMNLYKEKYGQPPIGEAHTTSTARNTPTSSGNSDERADKLLGNKYYVQIGVYSKKDNADKTAATYKKSGYKTLVENYNKQGQVFYRVLLGSYNSKSQADYIKVRLEKSAGEKYTLLVR
jgi:predicted negative regulator of RcsB-dependent stress response